MATYTKTTIELSITLHGVDDPITVSGDEAWGVLASIEQGNTLHIPADGAELIVPYHAVIAVTVTKSTEEVTKEDANCVVESDDSNNETPGN